MAKRRGDDHGGGGHDGAGGMRWLLTYSDMITLVMAFFIMLYAMSRVDLVRFEKTAFAIRAGFGQAKATEASRVMTGGGPADFPPRYRIVEKNELIKTALKKPTQNYVSAGGEEVQRDQQSVPSNPNKEGFAKGQTKEEVQAMENLGKAVKGQLRGTGLAKDVSVGVDERGLVVRIKSDNILFDLGKADLKPQSIPIMKKLAKTLRRVPNTVRVEGHTDVLPISTYRYPSNWELSTARASSVIRYWIKTGMLPQRRLSAAGYAASRPIATNKTSYGRALNRRVEVVVMWKGS